LLRTVLWEPEGETPSGYPTLVVERRRSKPSQPNNLTVIKYVSRNSTVGEHGTTWGVVKRQVSMPAQ
jgi:hypothetical protein